MIHNLILLISFYAFNAYGMTNDTKFNWEGLPQDLKIKIALDTFENLSVDENRKFVTPEKFYNNLLRLRKLNKAAWLMIKTAISQVNLKNLYFPNDILKKKFPAPLTTQALVYAIRFNSLEVAELLLLLGANAKVWDKKIERPVIDILYKQRSLANKLLLKYGESTGEKLLVNHGAIEGVSNDWDNEQIKTAIENNNIEAIKNLIASGINIEGNLYGSRYYYTALTYAINIGNLDVVKELINAGANVNTNNDHDDTPLTCAAQYGKLEIVKELINAGANLDAKGYHYKRNTALTYALNDNSLEIFEELIRLRRRHRTNGQ